MPTLAEMRIPVTGLDGKTYAPSWKSRSVTDNDRRRFELDEIARRTATLYGKTIALHEQMKTWEKKWRYTTYDYELEEIDCISGHLTAMQHLLAEMSSPTERESPGTKSGTCHHRNHSPRQHPSES